MSSWPWSCCRWSRAPPEPVNASATQSQASSWRAFAAGVLMNSAMSRNIDNVLVEQVSGTQQLAFYGPTPWPIDCSYCRCSWPAPPSAPCVPASRGAPATWTRYAPTWRGPPERLPRRLSQQWHWWPRRRLQLRAAPVRPRLGHPVPIVQFLAMVGALQAIYPTVDHTSGPGARARRFLNLRLAWLTTVVRNHRNHSGLPFGAFGVAIGYSVATGLLIPVEWLSGGGCSV